MKIDVHCSLFAPHIGGIETMVGEMGSSLNQEGHDMSVLTKRWPLDLPPIENIRGIDVRRIPAGWSDEAILQTAHYLHENMDELMQGVDVIHAVGMRRPTPIFSALLGSLYRIPVVSSVCGIEIPNPNTPASDKLWAEGSHYMPDAYNNIGTHTAVSEATKNYTEDIQPQLKGKVTVLPVGIDLDHYDSLPPQFPVGIDRPYIMALRRLEPTKGIDVLIKAYSILLGNSEDKGVDLVIAGDGSARASLEELARMLKIEHRVHFIGSLALDNALGMLRSAEATVVPSTAEAGGLINTEANAVECPLIASDVGGIREYTTDKAAILVKPGDPQDLALAISTLLHDKKMRYSMTREGRRFAETRSWKSIIKDYIDTYERARVIKSDQLKLSSDLSKKVLNIMESGHDK